MCVCVCIDSFPELVSNAVWIPSKQRCMGPAELVTVYLLQFTVCGDFLVCFSPDGCMALGTLPFSVKANPLKWTQVITCFNEKENDDGAVLQPAPSIIIPGQDPRLSRRVIAQYDLSVVLERRICEQTHTQVDPGWLDFIPCNSRPFVKVRPLEERASENGMVTPASTMLSG